MVSMEAIRSVNTNKQTNCFFSIEFFILLCPKRDFRLPGIQAALSVGRMSSHECRRNNQNQKHFGERNMKQKIEPIRWHRCDAMENKIFPNRHCSHLDWPSRPTIDCDRFYCCTTQTVIFCSRFDGTQR